MSGPTQSAEAKSPCDVVTSPNWHWPARVGAVAAPAVVRAQAAFNWKMTSFYGPNAAFYSTGPGSAKDLISRIEAMSGGRIKIQFYGAGELIPAAEGFDAVSSGTVEMNYANAYFWTGKVFAGQYFTAVPFGLNFQGLNGWMYDGGGLAALAEVYDRFNLVPFLCGNTGVQMTGWFKKPIEKVDDLKGLKMRIPGLAGRVYQQLGVDVRLLPPGEIFPGAGTRRDRRRRIRRPLSRPSARSASRGQILLHDRLARDGDLERAHHQQGEMGRACRPISRRSIENACAACNVISEAWCQKNNAEAMEDLIKNQGVIAQPLPDAVVEALREANTKILAEAVAKDPVTKKVNDFVHGLHGEVQGMVRPTANPSITARFSRADVTSAERLAVGIDAFIDLVGRITAWSSFALALVMGGNVLLRYVFNTGSVWSQELEWHLMSPICLFGMSYALRHGEHVRVDVLYRVILGAQQATWSSSSRR